MSVSQEHPTPALSAATGNRRIVLCSVSADLHAAWQSVAASHPDICDVFDGDIRLLDDADAWVSPANSFGFMDGGIDAVIADHYHRQGIDVQAAVRASIKRAGGELLVGQALAVATGGHPAWLIVAPTMRIPQPLPADTVNPYLAAQAVLRCLDTTDLGRVVLPGLGTLTGRVPAAVCARQVTAAIDAWKAGWPPPTDWEHVRAQYRALL